jgi:hypothetical protein
MARVFVSHAWNDREYVDAFVDNVLRLGCGLPPEELFYSSGEDTGVPSGLDLLAHVRKRVEQADVVIAVISATYLTRPVCMAEMGAAWGVAGRLFPLLTPGMERTDLEGVLGSLAVRYIDAKPALNELSDVVGEAVGHKPQAKTWGSYSEKWLAASRRLKGTIPVPEIVAPVKYQQAMEDLEAARDALVISEERVDELEEQVERLADATTPQEAAEIRLPRGERQKFHALVRDVQASVAPLERVVADAVYWDVVLGQAMPYPNENEDYSGSQTASRLLHEGELQEDFDHAALSPDYGFPDAERARKAVERLKKFFEWEATPEFVAWFVEEKQTPFDLKKRRTWDNLL